MSKGSTDQKNVTQTEKSKPAELNQDDLEKVQGGRGSEEGRREPIDAVQVFQDLNNNG